MKSKDAEEYEKTAPGMGMHVEIKDPEKKVKILLKIRLLEFLGCFGTRLWIRGQVYLHFAHARRASNLYSLELDKMEPNGPSNNGKVTFPGESVF